MTNFLIKLLEEQANFVSVSTNPITFHSYPILFLLQIGHCEEKKMCQREAIAKPPPVS